MVDVVSLAAARRLDRALAQSKSGPQGGPGGANRCPREYARSTGRLLSKRNWWFFGNACEIIKRSLTGNKYQCFELQLIYTGGKRFVCARCFRFEPANGGVASGTGTTGSFRASRNAYHAEFKRRRRRHTRGVL